MGAIAVHATTSERLPVFVDVMGRALSDDPIFRWPLERAQDLPTQFTRFIAAIFGPLMDGGTIWEAGDGLGFADWVPPGAASNALETDDELAAFLATIADDGAARYEAMWSWLVERVPDDVWYLDTLGVDPGHQGRGVGTALVRFGLDRAAVDGADAFLETSVGANVPYYERFGFQVVLEDEPKAGPHIWFMRREPGAR